MPPFQDIIRIPPTGNHTLQAWSAADEYLLEWHRENAHPGQHCLLYNDRFGYLVCNLPPQTGFTGFMHQHSQMRSNEANLERSGRGEAKSCLQAFDQRYFAEAQFGQKGAFALIRLPKSLDLFEFFLMDLVQRLPAEGIALCGFMTRHFSPRMVAIAACYFEEVQQSRAWKKARLLILKKPKAIPFQFLQNRVGLPEGGELRQYFGVFSAARIDEATSFLLENLPDGLAGDVLDLGCGNGIIGRRILAASLGGRLHCLDDSYLAVASARLNLPETVNFQAGFNLDAFPDASLDHIVTNPPFHFEFEIDISQPLRLFRESNLCLRPGGSLILVANRHLNYRTHLQKDFPRVREIASNLKFEILACEV